MVVVPASVVSAGQLQFFSCVLQDGFELPRGAVDRLHREQGGAAPSRLPGAVLFLVLEIDLQLEAGRQGLEASQACHFALGSQLDFAFGECSQRRSDRQVGRAYPLQSGIERIGAVPFRFVVFEIAADVALAEIVAPDFAGIQPQIAGFELQPGAGGVVALGDVRVEQSIDTLIAHAVMNTLLMPVA